MKVTSALLTMAVVSMGGSGAALPSPAPPVPAGHPRVYLRPDDLPTLRAKSKDRGARRLWQSVGRHSSDPVVLAFTGLLEQDATRLRLGAADLARRLLRGGHADAPR